MTTLPREFLFLIDLVFGTVGLAFLLVLLPVTAWKFCQQKLQWRKKRNRPAETVQATILTKEFHTNAPRRASYVYTQQLTIYTITFETQTGEQLQLQAPGELYGLLSETDFGELTYQDSRCLSFVLQKLPVQP